MGSVLAVRVCGLVLAPVAMASGAVSVAIPADGRGNAVHITGVIEAPIGAVEAAVLDVRGYPSWFPGAASVQTDVAPVFHAIFDLPWPLSDAHETLRFDRSTSADVVTIAWRQLRGDMLRDEGSWTLRPIGLTQTEVRYDALLQFRGWVPGWLVRRVERKGAVKLLRALEGRARRMVPRCAKGSPLSHC